jgi:hypothetical protein
LPALVAADPILLLRGHGHLGVFWYRAAAVAVASLPAAILPAAATFETGVGGKSKHGSDGTPPAASGLLIHASCHVCEFHQSTNSTHSARPPAHCTLHTAHTPGTRTSTHSPTTHYPLTHSPTHPLAYSSAHPLTTPSPPTHHPLTLSPIPHPCCPCHSCHSCRCPPPACRLPPRSLLSSVPPRPLAAIPPPVLDMLRRRF